MLFAAIISLSEHNLDAPYKLIGSCLSVDKLITFFKLGDENDASIIF